MKSGRYYRAFGLGIRSDFRLPLPPDPERATDLTLRAMSLERLQRTVLRLPGAMLEVGEGRAFVAEDGRQVWFARGSLTEAQAVDGLLGMVMLQVLVARGIHCFHGTAVAVGSEAWAFLGSSGSGKSTLAAALLRQGAELVADDFFPVVWKGSEPYGVPTHPCLRLWEDASRALGLPLERAVPARGYEGKYVFRDAFTFAREPLPLRRVFLLNGGGDLPRFPPPAERARLLLELLLRPPAAGVRTLSCQVRFVADLVGRVSVSVLRLPRNLGALGSTAEAMLRQGRAGTEASPS